jgi:hypothetical protein
MPHPPVSIESYHISATASLAYASTGRGICTEMLAARARPHLGQRHNLWKLLELGFVEIRDDQPAVTTAGIATLECYLVVIPPG